MSNPAVARENMIEGQLRPNEVYDEKLIEAIKSVKREEFVPKALQGVAYLDEDIQVAQGRYLMEPMVFARLLSEANVKSDEVVLDVAPATGYSSAVLCRLAETVVALEEDDALFDEATETLAREACDNVAVVKGSLVEGLAKQGPYDVIFINGQIDETPINLLEQLSDKGRLLCVLNDNGVGKAAIMTYRDGIPGVRILFDASVPPLPSFRVSKGFSF